MRIGVNGWRLHGPRTGVRRYLFNVLRQWARDGTGGDEVRLYLPAPGDGEELPPGALELRVLSSSWPMLVWENLRLGPWTSDDVLFCPSFSRPLVSRARSIAVVTFDAVSRLHPELFPRSVRYLYNPLYGWSARHASVVIAATEASRQDVSRCFRVPPSRIRVVHLAPAECFRPGVPEAEAEAARSRHVGSADPFFLFVGKLSGRRSLPPLLEAFAQLKRGGLPHKLLLVGLNPHSLDLVRMIAAAGVEREVRYAGYVDDTELNRLYNAAVALVMPSVYETISLPVMEAQATETPVICIDTAGMREITGQAAEMVPILEPEPLSAAMRAVASDEALRQRLAAEGLANAARFSWSRCARETLAVLREAGSA